MTINSWWGRHSVFPGRTDLYQLGPLHLWIQQQPHQWTIAWHYAFDWLDSTVRIEVNSSTVPPAKKHEKVHCAFGALAHHSVLFTPALPERPLIARLATPLHILPNETLTIYVLSPLHLKIQLTEPEKLIYQIPCFRLSDTWFGPLNSDGEIGFASTEPAFLDIHDVPLRLHCAISAVTVRNSGMDSLYVDRLKIPLPHLSLFYSPRTGFWTDSFVLDRREGAEMATLKLNHQPPAEASPSQIIASAHVPISESHSLIRSFGAFFKDRMVL